MWSGLPQLLVYPSMPFLARRIDPRILVMAGTLFFAWSCFLNVNLTHDVGMDELIFPQLLRAAGQPLFTIPLSQLATANLAPRNTADAAALSSMMKNLGGSIGIAMLSTMVQRREQFHFSVLAEAMTRNATRTQEQVRFIAGGLRGTVTDSAIATEQALTSIALICPPGSLCVSLFRCILDGRRWTYDQHLHYNNVRETC